MKFQYSVGALALITLMASASLAVPANAQTIPGTNVPIDSSLAGVDGDSGDSGSSTTATTTTTATTASSGDSLSDVGTLTLPTMSIGSIQAATAPQVGELNITAPPTFPSGAASQDSLNNLQGALQRGMQNYSSTVAGRQQMNMGIVNPALCGQMDANANAAAADASQRISDMLAQTASPPPAAQTTCLDLAGANITNMVIDLTKSNGFAKKFYNDSVLKGMQKFASNFPLGGVLSGVVNNLMSNAFDNVMSKLNLGALGNAIGGIVSASKIDTSKITCDSMGKSFKTMRCLTRMAKNPLAAANDEQCVDRAAMASLADRIIPPVDARAAAAAAGASSVTSVGGTSSPSGSSYFVTPDLNGLY